MIQENIILRISRFSYLFFSLFFVCLPTSAYNLDDYQPKFGVVSERLDFIKNNKNLLNLVEGLEKDIAIQRRELRNTGYLNAKKELDLAKKELKNASDFFRRKETKKMYQSLKIANKQLKFARLQLMPSRSVETRGIYLDADSIPKNKKEITTLLEKIKSAGFNVIYPEIFSRGYSIMRNPFSDISPDFEAANFDVLQYLAQECLRLDLELQPWIWTFRVKSPLFDSTFVSRYPELMARRENYRFEEREPIFLSPAEPKVRKLMLDYLLFIAQKYEISGFLLDYIRYDETLGDDLLSKKYFRQYYLNKYQKEPPVNIQKGTADFVEWQLWRESQVTSFVRDVNQNLKSLKLNLKIGVAVFRTEKEGRLTKMQDWRHWANNAYVDYICPMLYTDNIKDLTDWLNSETDGNQRKDFLFPSLGALRFYTDDDLFLLAGLIQERKITGFNIFSLAHYSPENAEYLRQGIFRKMAISANKELKAVLPFLFLDVEQWLKNSLIEKDSPKNELNKLMMIVAKIKNKLGNPNDPELKKLFNDLENTAINYANLGIFSKNFVSDLQDELNYAKKLMEINEVSQQKKQKYTQPKMPPLEKVAKKKNFGAEIYQKKVDEADPLAPFFWTNGIAEGSNLTTVKASYDQNFLYFLFENYESNFLATVAKTRKNGQKSIFADDSVSVYLQKYGDEDYFRFTVNMNNVKYDSLSSKENWHSDFKTDVRLFADYWTAELKIPLNKIGLSPKKNQRIKINFSRYRPQELVPLLEWSPSEGKPEDSSTWGNIVLE